VCVCVCVRVRVLTSINDVHSSIFAADHKRVSLDTNTGFLFRSMSFDEFQKQNQNILFYSLYIRTDLCVVMKTRVTRSLPVSSARHVGLGPRAERQPEGEPHREWHAGSHRQSGHPAGG